MTAATKRPTGQAGKLSLAEIERLRVFFEAGMTTTRILERTGFSRHAVQRWRRRWAANAMAIVPAGRRGASGDYIVQRLCWADQCYDAATDGKFCKRHKFHRPANAARLMGARA